MWCRAGPRRFFVFRRRVVCGIVQQAVREEYSSGGDRTFVAEPHCEGGKELLVPARGLGALSGDADGIRAGSSDCRMRWMSRRSASAWRAS